MHPALLLLQKIPRGKVTTYAALAKATHSSPRAIGSVLRSNKHPESYPCYKVVRTDGTLGGYCGETSGASIEKKIALLARDGIVVTNGSIDLSKHLFDFSLKFKRRGL